MITTERMIVTVEQRTVWGNDLYYPINELAKKFCELLGVKTLAMRHMHQIQEMGITVGVY